MQTAQGSILRVLMYGWELPPFNSGGLGVACLGLARGLVEQGVEVTFVLPKKLDIDFDLFKVVNADTGSIKLLHIDSPLYGYVTPYEYKSRILVKKQRKGIYGMSLLDEVMRYAEKAREIARSENFDIIHAHDWLSFPAGVAAKEVSDKPLLVHVHATEFDRTGGHNVNRDVFEIEKEGMEKSDRVIAVSGFTKNMITNYYGIRPYKVDVVHNGVDSFDSIANKSDLVLSLSKDDKIVLFVGRLTLQKGPDYFLRAAKKVLEYDPHVVFVITGEGDMKRKLITEAAYLGISDKVIFTGFLRGEDLRNIYRSADLFVMPSVSEPFGITSLESLMNGTPVMVSKQSGVAETISHALKVDFWDVDEMANKILSVLAYSSLQKTLKDNGKREVQKMTWQESARKTVEVYREVLTLRSV